MFPTDKVHNVARARIGVHPYGEPLRKPRFPRRHSFAIPVPMHSENPGVPGLTRLPPQALPAAPPRTSLQGFARAWQQRFAAPVAARPPLPLWLGALCLASYVLADAATGLFPHPRFGVQPLSPHPALAVTLLAIGGPAYTGPVLVAVLLAWWISPGAAIEWAAALPAAVAFTLLYGAAAYALRRWTRWGDAAVAPRDVNGLLAIAVPTVVLCAVVDALRQMATPAMSESAFPLLTFRLFVANLLGMAVLMPILLQLISGVWVRQARALAPRRTVRAGLVFLIVLCGLLELVFGLRPLDEFRMSYLLFLPVIVVAMRAGVFGVVSVLPVVQLGLLGALTVIGTRAGTAFEFQMLMLTLAVATLYLGALSDERQRAAARIADNERALRERGNALAEAQRMASTAELAAALAHDLSQPLSAIGTYASASQVLARRGEADHAKLIETLDQITRESARAGQYLRRMRDFFRTGVMHEECVTVATLVEGTYAHLRDRLLRADIRWTMTLEPSLPPVRADAVQLGAVLGNLVANACDALAGQPGPRAHPHQRRRGRRQRSAARAHRRRGYGTGHRRRGAPAAVPAAGHQQAQRDGPGAGIVALHRRAPGRAPVVRRQPRTHDLLPGSAGTWLSSHAAPARRSAACCWSRTTSPYANRWRCCCSCTATRRRSSTAPRRFWPRRRRWSGRPARWSISGCRACPAWPCRRAWAATTAVRRCCS